MNARKTLLALLIFGLLGLIYFYFFVYNKSHPEYEKLKPDYFLSAEALYQEYSSDPDSASAKYNGKIIQISGSVSSLEFVDSLQIATFVFSEGMFGNEGIRCTFLNVKTVSSLDDLTGKDIKGFCSGYNETDVILTKCTPVPIH